MCGALGSLLLLWSEIERSTREEVLFLNEGGVAPKPGYGFAALLREWDKRVIAKHPSGSAPALLASALTGELRKAQKIRNALCHRLDGISASQEEKPAALTWRTANGTGRITWPELQISFHRLSKYPRAMSILSRYDAMNFDRMRLDDAENRQWWFDEFGLSVSAPQTG